MELEGIIKREIMNDPEIMNLILRAKQEAVASKFVERLEKSIQESGISKEFEDRLNGLEKSIQESGISKEFEDRLKELDGSIDSIKIYQDDNSEKIDKIARKMIDFEEQNIKTKQHIGGRISHLEKDMQDMLQMKDEIKHLEKDIIEMKDEIKPMKNVHETLEQIKDKHREDIRGIKHEIGEDMGGIKHGLKNFNHRISKIENQLTRVSEHEKEMEEELKKESELLQRTKVKKNHQIVKDFGDMIVKEFPDKILLVLSKQSESKGKAKVFDLLIVLRKGVNKGSIDIEPFHLKVSVSQDTKISPEIMDFEEFEEKDEIFEEIKNGEIVFAHEDLLNMIKKEEVT